MPESIPNSSGKVTGSNQDSQKEVDELLALAEALQEKVDLWERRSLQASLILIISLLISLAPLFWWVLTHWTKFPFEPPSNSLSIVLSFFFALFVSGITAGYQIGTIRDRRQRELHALEEVVSLLRETEQAFGKGHNWSALERARFRIRLSRFSVGRSRRVLGRGSTWTD